MAKVDGQTQTPGSPGSGALVLAGFMGAGKSTALHNLSGFSRVLDSDELLESELGMSIPDFFASEGEATFRIRETELVCDLLARADSTTVIALGGGSLNSEAVREALAGHTVVWLPVEADEAWERVSGDSSRPLAVDRDDFEALLVERTPIYRECADATVIADGPESAASAIAEILSSRDDAPAHSHRIWFASEAGSYPVWLGRNIIGRTPTRATGRRFCISDSSVAEIYAERLDSERTFIVEPGEGSKTVASAERLWQEMADAGVLRTDHLVALGGGVVGDLGGFCAATYQRGVDLVQVPTSLVAQVDSAFGGKTGVDLPGAKNFVGSFHQPLEVLVDLDCLETLPEAEAAAGWAEVVKTALLAGGALWDSVRAFDPALLRDPEAMEPVVTACAEFKLTVVAADQRDDGRRQTLNLGHTVGHGIETAGGYSHYRHGESVSLGLLAALSLSGADALRDDVVDVLGRAGLPTTLDPAIPTETVLEAVSHDKKRDASGVKFVLIDAPGSIRWGERVEESDLLAAIERLREDETSD